MNLYKSNYGMVKEFHITYELGIAAEPVAKPTRQTKMLQLKLIAEEFIELCDAMGIAGELQFGSHVHRVDYKTKNEHLGDYNAVEVADGLADIEYLLNSAALTLGIPLPACFKEVHRSNMSKLDENGKPIIRSDGKILKGPNYSPPDLAKVLFF